MNQESADNPNKRRNFFATNAFWQRLTMASVRYDVPCSEIIRTAVSEYLDHKEQPNG